MMQPPLRRFVPQGRPLPKNVRTGLPDPIPPRGLGFTAYHHTGMGHTAYHHTGQSGVDGITDILWSPTARVVGTFLGAFHGYRRNKSIGWAVLWALLGGASPVITAGVALAQGFGKPKSKKGR